MPRVTSKSVIQTAIISAFTFAAALIWKDVIVEFIELLVPPREELFFKLIAAILATVLVVVVIFVFLKTESEAELIMRRLKQKKKK